MRRYAIVLACSAFALSATAAFAQSSNSPAGDGKVSPIIMPPAPGAPAEDQNPRVPGATGDARVPGDASTMVGDRKATIEDRTGASTGGGN